MFFKQYNQNVITLSDFVIILVIFPFSVKLSRFAGDLPMVGST